MQSSDTTANADSHQRDVLVRSAVVAGQDLFTMSTTVSKMPSPKITVSMNLSVQY